MIKCTNDQRPNVKPVSGLWVGLSPRSLKNVWKSMRKMTIYENTNISKCLWFFVGWVKVVPRDCFTRNPKKYVRVCVCVCVCVYLSCKLKEKPNLVPVLQFATRQGQFNYMSFAYSHICIFLLICRKKMSRSKISYL